jgi:hypothetical protein
MSALRSLVVAAAAAAALSACAPLAEQAELNSPEARTTLVVENKNWSEMVIYLVRGSSRARLGSVLSMTTAKFPIADVLTGGPYGELRIQADPVGSSRTYTSPVIHVVPGTQAELSLANNISMSHFSVF